MLALLLLAPIPAEVRLPFRCHGCLWRRGAAGDWATHQRNSVTDFDWGRRLQPAKKKNKGRTNLAMVRMARTFCEWLATRAGG